MTNNQKKDDNQTTDSLKSIVNTAKDVKCPICLTNISNRAVTDSCCHEFCFECINQWSTNHNRCPICRQMYSNIKFNFTSDKNFDQMPVEDQPEVSEEEIEAILHRMLLYLRLIGLRNRTQRLIEQMTQDLTTFEEEILRKGCNQKKKKELKQNIKQIRTDLRQLREDLHRFNETLSAESPSEEQLNEVLNGRENEIQDIEVIDIIFDPSDFIQDNSDDPTFLSSDNESGNESDDEHDSDEEEVNPRKRRASQLSDTEVSDDSDDSVESSSPKRRKRH